MTMPVIARSLFESFGIEGDHQLVLTFMDDVSVLIDQLGGENQYTPTRLAGCPLAGDMKPDVQAVADLDGQSEIPCPAKRHARHKLKIGPGLESIGEG